MPDPNRARQDMFGRNKNREDNRYYLLPGMGRSNKRHRALVFRWSLVAGLIGSAIFGLILYLLQRR